MDLLEHNSLRRHLPLREAAEAVPMVSDAPFAEAARSVMAAHLYSLLQSLPIARAGEDPEGVHDARVAIRRLRAVLATTAGTVHDPDEVKRLRRSLSSLASSLGRVRDADVFLLALDEYEATLSAEERNRLQVLRKHQDKRRAIARRAALKQLKNEKTNRMLRRLEQFVTTPGEGVWATDLREDAIEPSLVHDFAGSVLWRRYEVVRAYEIGLAGAPAATLHRLRIEIKWLRYTLDLFLPALAPEAKALREQIAHAQEHLGLLQDAEVALSFIAQALHDDPGNHALLTYRANRSQAHHQLHLASTDEISPLFEPSFRERLASLIAAL